MNRLNNTPVLAVTLVVGFVLGGCSSPAKPAPVVATSSPSGNATETTPPPHIYVSGEDPNLDDLAGGQFGDYESVIDVPTLHGETVESIFQASPLVDASQTVTHDDFGFTNALTVVAEQKPLEPNLGGAAETPKQPGDSGMKIADAAQVVDNYFNAVMSAMETGDSSQLGKITWEQCQMCSDTKMVVDQASDPDTYKETHIYYGGLVFPSGPLEFVKTDGAFYHFKTSAVERAFLSSLLVDPWIMRDSDAGKFVMDIVVAETADGWMMAFYDVTSIG